MKLETLSLDAIRRNPHNPREASDDDPELASLASSIAQSGLLQPITVRPIPLSDVAGSDPVCYEIVAGERRWRASRLAGVDTITAIVRTDLTDQQVLELIVVENLQREDLHPLEEAEGYRQLLALEGRDVASIAGRVGRSVKYVYDRVKLLSLTEESQKLFRSGRITAGHAILLARLRPDEQARAIERGLFTPERLLWDPREDDERPILNEEPEDREEPKKPVSVRELQAWIDEHVKFDVEAVEPMLFPETAAQVQTAREEAEKIVPITHDSYVQEDARDGARVFGPRSWKPADGRGKHKECEHAVTGVVVVGPGRGEAFKVCIAKKKCTTHWGQEQRESAKRAKATATSGATGAERHREEEERRKAAQAREEAEQARWKKALPAILEALAAKVKKASPAPGKLLATVLFEAVRPSWDAKGIKVADYMPLGRTAEDLVRHAVFILLLNSASQFYARSEFPKRLKAFGLDAKAILDAAAPEKPAQTSAAPKTPAAAKKKPAKKKAKAAAA